MSDENTWPVELERAIFLGALKITGAQARAAFLEKECGGNQRLRAAVESLLRNHTEGDFMARAGDTSRLGMVSEKPGDRIGRYKLLQKIGEGGCGVVYMAEQQEPIKRRVALKVIKPGMDTRLILARFEAERQALALMDHPNIAKVLDAGASESGRPYFVMELVRGVKITEYCDDPQNQLATKQRLQIFIQICRAIQHAHQKGIIHRDIKPSNILVTLQEDGTPVPKIIDFGIAKATAGQVLTNKTLFTAFEQFIGTPAYMSPEQAAMTAIDIDTRSDIYSLGVLLYELLTGSTPFDSAELVSAGFDEIRRIICEEEPPRPSTRLSTLQADVQNAVAKRRQSDPPKLRNLVRGDLDWIVMKALEKDRTRRYETASGLAADIERHLHNEAVLARPPTAAYRLQRMIRRHKLAFAAAGAVTVALIMGVVASSWQAIRATRAEQSERSARQLAVSSEKKLARGLYASRMNLAAQAWADANIRRGQQLLDQYLPKPGQEDLRGFEWFYIWHLFHSQQLTLRHEDAPMRSVAFSPDGRFIATGGDDATARIWDSDTGKLVFKLAGHECRTNSHATNGFPFVYGPGVNSVAYAPDGKTLATGGCDETVRLWDTATGAQKAVLPGHDGGVTFVAFAPDGTWLAAATGKLGDASYHHGLFAMVDDDPLASEVKIWDMKSRKVIRTFRGYKKSILSMAISSDGKWIAAGDVGGDVKLWNVASGELKANLSESNMPAPSRGSPESRMTAIGFSPDARILAIATSPEITEGRIEFWDTATGEKLKTIRTQGFPRALAFSPDGKTIAVGEGDYTVRFLNVATGQEIRAIKGHTWAVACLAYNGDGQRIATAGWDQKVKVWDAAHPPDYTVLPGTSGSSDDGCCRGCFSPDGKYLIIGSSNLTAFEIGTRKEPTNLGDYMPFDLVALSPTVLATGGFDHDITLREVGTWRNIGTLKDSNSYILRSAFSPDGQWLATASWEKIKLWNVKEQKLEHVFPCPTGYYPGSLQFTPDGRLIMRTTPEKIRFLDVENGREVKSLAAPGHFYAGLSPDGRFLASASGNELWLTDFQTMEVKWRAKIWGRIVSICFSPDSKTIATAGWDNKARLWNVASGEEMFVGGIAQASHVTFSPDGKWWSVGGVEGETLFRAATLAEVDAAAAEADLEARK